MNPAAHGLFDDCLVCDDRLALRYDADAALHAAADAGQAEHCLRMIALTDEAPPDFADERVNADALAYLDAKLTLALDLLGAVLAAQQTLPPLRDVHWSRRGMTFVESAPLAAGTRGRLRLYLLPGRPLPLDLAATVVACENVADGCEIALRFDGGDALEAALERQIFRRHRRHIAQLKRTR